MPAGGDEGPGVGGEQEALLSGEYRSAEEVVAEAVLVNQALHSAIANAIPQGLVSAQEAMRLAVTNMNLVAVSEATAALQQALQSALAAATQQGTPPIAAAERTLDNQRTPEEQRKGRPQR